jgi:histidine triad (HIT) family protein
MQTCVFCRIARKEIPSDIIHEDEDLLAFRDLNPQAPVHILIVPKKHLEGVLALAEADAGLVGKAILLAGRLARKDGVAESGFRLVCNTNRDAGQSVPHLHIHLLGGRAMGWPPG